MVDGPKMTAINGPTWEDNTAACRASTGYPWKTGSMFAGQTACSNTYLYGTSGGNRQEPAFEDGCAPWEDSSLTAAGAPKCMSQRYAWESGPSNAMWLPAPDTCTQMPADTNRVYRDPNLYAPATGGDGSCTGAAKAPNCPTGSTHPGCTGVEETAPQVATKTVTATASNVPGSASSTQNATAEAVRDTVTRKASERFRGKRVTAKGSAQVVKRATETRTVEQTATASATRTASMSCTAPTMTEAEACALNKAQAEAHRLAYADAEVLATQAAATQAETAAEDAALAAAQQTAQTAPVTTEERQAAGKTAQRRAEKALARKIRRMR